MKYVVIALTVLFFCCSCAKYAVIDVNPQYADEKAKVESLLNSRVSLKIDMMPFSEAVSFLSNSAGLNLCLSSDVPSDEEMKNIKITIHANGEVLREILDEICRQANMKWTYPSPDIPEEYRYSKVVIGPRK